MRVNEKKNQRGRDAFAIGVWENEGGALAQHSIYHVFTGVPARRAEVIRTGDKP